MNIINVITLFTDMAEMFRNLRHYLLYPSKY